MLKFFQKPSLEEKVRLWTQRLRREQRKVEQQIAQIRREEAKVKILLKQAVKANDLVAARGLAREILRSHKAVSRLYAAKAQMNSVSMRLQGQIGQKKLLGSVRASTEILKEMNALVRVREVHADMRELGKEIQKAGIIDEMTSEVIDNALDDGEISDTELEEEVNKVVEEVAQKQMEGTHVRLNRLPQKEEKEEEKEDVDEELLTKLSALRTS